MPRPAKEQLMRRSPMPKWQAIVFIAALFVACTCVIGTQHTLAETRHLCPTGCDYTDGPIFTTIGAALYNTQPGDVVLVEPGVYHESIGMRPGVRIQSRLGPERTTITAEGRPVVVGTGVIIQSSSVLDGFTITGGRSTPTSRGGAIYIDNRACEIISNNIISGCVASEKGGGIYIKDAETAPTIINNRFINNLAHNGAGGAIYVEDAAPLITSNYFSGNHSDKDGGAVAIYTISAPNFQVTLANNEFVGNSADARGGALYLQQTRPAIRSNTIRGNTALSGGGIYVLSRLSGGQALIEGNEIAYNSTYGTSTFSYGGGLVFATQADAVLSANRIHHNSSWKGDGIYVENASPRLINNALWANGQKGIWIYNASPSFINNTLLGSVAPGSVGVYLAGSSRPAIVNNIIASHAYGIQGDGTASPSITFNDVWGNATANYSRVTPGVENLSADPLLRDAASGDVHLLGGSPAIDVGTGGDAPGSDWEGDARPQDGNQDGTAAVDVGADEFVPPSGDITPMATATPTPTATATPTPTDTLTAGAATPTPTSTPTIATATPTRTSTSVPSATSTPSGSGVTVVLQQGSEGYAGCLDTHIYQYAPDTNYVWHSLLQIGYKQQYAGLIRFDVASIPADALVTSASLDLYAVGWNATNLTLGAYYITRTTDLTQATWNQATAGNPWALVGCNSTTADRCATPATSMATSGIAKWYSLDVTALVQGWVDGSLVNNGLLLRAAYSSGSFSFASAESANTLLRPKLKVGYTSGGTNIPTATATITQVPSAATSTATPTATPTTTATQVQPLTTSTATPTATPTPTMPTATRTATPSPTATSTTGEGTIVLQQGLNDYVGANDTYLYAYGGGNNYCYEGQFKVGYKQQYAGLLHFDLTPIPSDAVVTRASFEVYASGWSGSNTTLAAYVLKHSSDACQATWSQAGAGSLWGLPGANDTNTDRNATPESSLTTAGIYRWYSLDVTAAVQGWLSGGQPNNGLLLRQTASASASFIFHSAESADPGFRPRLVVAFHR